MAAHYIQDPIYMRGDFLTKGRTYGDSQFPLTVRTSAVNTTTVPNSSPAQSKA